jgi:hypothetical protein
MESDRGRGGFMLAPRGLEVLFVSRNDSASLLPAGVVILYSGQHRFQREARPLQRPPRHATAFVREDLPSAHQKLG